MIEGRRVIIIVCPSLNGDDNSWRRSLRTCLIVKKTFRNWILISSPLTPPENNWRTRKLQQLRSNSSATSFCEFSSPNELHMIMQNCEMMIDVQVRLTISMTSEKLLLRSVTLNGWSLGCAEVFAFSMSDVFTCGKSREIKISNFQWFIGWAFSIAMNFRIDPALTHGLAELFFHSTFAAEVEFLSRSVGLNSEVLWRNINVSCLSLLRNSIAWYQQNCFRFGFHKKTPECLERESTWCDL